MLGLLLAATLVGALTFDRRSWPGLVGDGTFFDPERFFIVCVNMPGSCYGSIGPL